MQKVMYFFVLFLFGTVFASSEVSLNLKAYVDPEVNIERIDDNGDLDIFSKVERCYRITSNVEKTVKVTFRSQNGWKLKHESNCSVFIPYEGIFRGNNREEVVGKNSDIIDLEYDEFRDQEYEFRVIFKAIGSMKNFSAGRYFDRVTISVSTKY